MARTASAGTSLDETFVSASDGGQPDWAHTSGWMVSSGEAWTISCVVMGHDQSARLSSLLAGLSDALMEAGQPWEVLIVHPGIDDVACSAMLGWAQLPGFRWLRPEGDVSIPDALWAGLERARGDLVIVVEPKSLISLEAFADVLRCWSHGAKLAWTEIHGGQAVVRSSGGPALRGEVELPANTGGMVLLDRQMLEAMLRARDRTVP